MLKILRERLDANVSVRVIGRVPGAQDAVPRTTTGAYVCTRVVLFGTARQPFSEVRVCANSS